MKRVDELSDEEIFSCIKSEKRLLDLQTIKDVSTVLQTIDSDGINFIPVDMFVNRLKSFHMPMSLLLTMTNVAKEDWLILRNELHNDAVQTCVELNKLLR